MIDHLKGEGYVRREFPGKWILFHRYGIDITKEPMLVYPTLHYQNGGLEINDRAETTIPGLFVAGEASGGVHGRNRLMGNSQLDIVVFGRRAGRNAGEKIKKGIKLGKMNLDHVRKYTVEVEKLGIDRKRISPIILPDYIPSHVKAKQLTTTYHGTLV